MFVEWGPECTWIVPAGIRAWKSGLTDEADPGKTILATAPNETPVSKIIRAFDAMANPDQG